MNGVFLLLILSWPFNSYEPRLEFETREQCVEVLRNLRNTARLRGYDEVEAFCVRVQK